HTTLQAQAHQDLPFEQLVEAVNPARSLAHSPLFQTMLVWQNTPQGELNLSGLDIEFVTPDQVTAKFDLLLSMEENGPLIEGCIEYASAMFDHATVARWVEHWQVLLKAMARDETQAIERLPLLTASQRQQVLIDWNATQADYPREQCVHELIEAQVQRSPESVAVTHGTTNLTYAELNAQANRLAHHLIALGVTADERVAIAMPRGAAMLVGLLAILKSGGAYVPIDPAYPAERVAYMLNDAAPKVLLTQASLEKDWTAYLPSDRIVCLDTDVRQWSGQPAHNPSVHMTPRHLAYVIYTSGSTGQPKGVMVPHGAVVNLLTSMRHIADLHSEDRLLAITTLNFDIAALELHGPLICGAQVVIADRDTVLDPVSLARCIEKHRITVMQATPNVWRLLLDSGWSGSAGLKALCGGEALSKELAQRLQPLCSALWNLYGPTETTIWSTAYRVRPLTHDAGSPPIGHPVANTRIYVLDAQGEPTPPGVIGEIHIAGDGVGRGYLHRSQLTQERFLPDPFAPASRGQLSARMYRTGDLGCWRADGALEYHGRNDFEVKIRGVRINPAEIESALARHPGVREVAVVAHAQGVGDKHLVAYVAPRAFDDTQASANGPGISFSLFYFGAEVHDPANKYGLYLESAQYADRHGFEAVWTPERHFHSVGGLYANPSVLSAALATVTQNIKLRSGSVVLPLHHPVRVAEEWAMVDNLSHGRAGVSVASGWHPQDFVLSPSAYALRTQEMLRGIEMIRTLWRGESIALPNGAGETSEIRIFPRPVQQELPLWITAAGNPDTFVQAGKVGANVLTHLLGQSMAELAQQIARYRQARLEAGHDPETGRVTLMIHTFLGDDVDKVRQQAKDPFINYLKSHVGLNSLAQGLNISMSGAPDVEALAELAFEQYSQTSALIGTPQSCRPLIQEARDIGVDEMACLIDWMDGPSAMAGLAHLNRLRELSQRTHPSWRELRRFLVARLPQHMIPSAAVFVDSLPVTANGKLDRKALPEPNAEASIIARYEAPSGPREAAVAQLWAELLGLQRVGRHDNFFELGGNSLMVVTVLERLRRAGMPAEVRMLFANPTPASLAASMTSGEAAGESPETIEVTL
ncbi:MAG: amino acid adenylation domain-containing protein, partial [Burkholderiales bacterium]|nr:amino acid adenylation domain-containing protein [Burkholderiales bacterium]